MQTCVALENFLSKRSSKEVDVSEIKQALSGNEKVMQRADRPGGALSASRVHVLDGAMP